MSRMIELLALWPGRQETLLQLEARGYHLPAVYKAIVDSKCSECDPDELQRFWNETSLEYIRSGGSTNSEKRLFRDRGHYRSEFLDELYERGPRKNGLPLYAPLWPFFEMLQAGDIVDEVAKRIDAQKTAELTIFESTMAGELNGAGKLEQLLAASAAERGFVWSKRRWRKLFAGELELSCAIDKGKRVSCAFDISLSMQVRSLRESHDIFEIPIRHFDWGLFYYKLHHGKPSYASLGVRASVELALIFGEQIEGGI